VTQPADSPATEAPGAQTSGRTLAGWAALLLLLAYAATGVYTVRTKERAVVQRCGRALPRVRKPDLYVGLPWGIDRVRRLKVLETKRVGVGLSLADRALGRRAEPRQAECLTGDRNLIRLSAIVHYTIADPKAYLFNAADVPALVRSLAAAELTRIVSGMSVDDVLTRERNAIRTQARTALQTALDRYGAGVLVKEISLPSDGVAPPPEVADAFADVTSARGDRQRAINRAHAYANDLLPKARGEAHRILSDAEAYAGEVGKKAEGEANRFLAEAEQLKEHRDITLKRLILETLEGVLARVKKVVMDGTTAETLDLGIIEGRRDDAPAEGGVR
jgi:membrane protease subunit HflK